MLLTPGFITDILGLMMLIPTFRQGIIKRILAKSHLIFQNLIMQTYKQQGYNGSPVIKGEISDKENNLLIYIYELVGLMGENYAI